MFPSQMIILMATAAARDSSKKLLAHPMDVTSTYIGCLYDSLVTRGYLRKNSSSEYRLTTKGQEALIEFLNQNRSNAKYIIKILQQLGIDIGQDIDKLEKEAIKVKGRSK